MQLYFMTEDALAYFKGNITYNLHHYRDENFDWIKEVYPDNPLQKFKLEVRDFTMDMSAEKPVDTDYVNVKIVYDALKKLTDVQATDERLWVGLAHSVLFEYMQYRYNLRNEVFDKEKIMQNFFFAHGKKRSLLHHPIARLWWVGRLIYDEKEKDSYQAIEYLKKDFSSKVLTFFSSNFSSNPRTTRIFLNTIKKFEQNGRSVTREQFRELIRYVNLLGGTTILDYLPEDYLQQKIFTHYFKQNK